MPAGKHSSVRVALAVPPLLHEQLSEWADAEGRPVASLCMYLVENGLRQAQREGIAPSLGGSVESSDDVIEAIKSTGLVQVKSQTRNTRSMNDKEFREYYAEQYKDLAPNEEPAAEDAYRMASIREAEGVGVRSIGAVASNTESKKMAILEKLLSALQE